MNTLLRFFQSPQAKIFMLAIVVFVIAYFVREHRQRTEGAIEGAPVRLPTLSSIEGEMLGIVEDPTLNDTVKPTREWGRTTPVEKLRVPPYKAPKPLPLAKPVSANTMTSSVEPLSLVHFNRKNTLAESASSQKTTQREPARKALDWQVLLQTSYIRARLISSLHSSDVTMPVLAEVTHDVRVQGRVVIPKGSEVHGTMQRGRSRDRVRADGRWFVVLPNGKKFNVTATALHQDFDPVDGVYGLDDMTHGIKGQIVKTDELLEYKRFAAAAFSAISRSSRQTVRGFFGQEYQNSLGNGVRDGVDAVADRYLRKLEEQIKGDGLYVRVPAGTAFYVAVLDVGNVGTGSVNPNKPGSPALTSTQNDLLLQREALQRHLDPRTPITP